MQGGWLASLHSLHTKIVTTKLNNMEEHTKNGIFFTEEIASINGAEFVLYPEPTHTKQQIREAIAEIKDNRDVVYIKVADERDRDERYIRDIFRHPLTHQLRWFQVNIPSETIREKRKQGLPVVDYIREYVLPFVAETEAGNLKKYGEEIYKS